MTTTDETSAPLPPPPPPPQRPRIERSRNDKYVGGVCGGLGRYFDIDPVILRVVIACLAIFGAGLLVYAVAWAFLPEEGQQFSIAQKTRRDGAHGRELLVIALIVIAGLFGLTGDVGGNNGFGWFLGIAILGGLFWWRREGGPHYRPPAAPPAANWPGQPPQPPVAPPAPSAFWAQTATTAPYAPTAPYAATAPAGGGPLPSMPWGYAPKPDKPARRRSYLGTMTFFMLLISVGVAALLDATGAVNVSAQGVLATVLMVTGAGLLVGAWFGRSRGLIALGLGLTLAVAAVQAVDLPWKGGTGDIRWNVTSAEALDDGYHVQAGSAVLDLTRVEFGTATYTMDVSLGLGDLTILVPDGVTTRVVGHLGVGDVTIFGQHQGGVGVDIDNGDPGTPQLLIKTRLGLGDMKVRHETS